ncbi:MAG: zinc metalloprotease HtpX [Candidatus Firestonebacteria bacterium]|nr:zinc metalloprotease HtpX [Candidatus Firestonebacteria bacterium]
MHNLFKTFLLLLVMTVLFMLLGDWLGGSRGMLMGLVVAGVMNLGSYWFSDKIVLAMYRARDPQPSERRVVALVENLATQANLPMPKVKMLDLDVPNAFATGRNPKHAVVAVTTSLAGLLNDRELTAVLAHELSHVRNRDILISAVAATLAGAIAMIARTALWFGGGRDRDNALAGIVLMILAPIAAFLIQMAISRSREFAADRAAGILTNRPLDLITALEKLHASVTRHPLEATPGGNVTAHLFIVNPFKAGGLASLFSTHPNVEQRAERLRALDQELKGLPKGI